MAVQLQIMSDLQLKTPQAYDRFEIPPMASYLALLGDIDHSTSAGLANFLTHQLTKFEVVFFLLGNHEPYHGSWEEVKARFRAFAAGTAQGGAETKIWDSSSSSTKHAIISLTE